MTASEPAAPAAAPVRRRRRPVVPAVRLAVVLALIVVVVLVTVVVVVVTGPPSEDSLLEQAGMVGKRELLVGVRDDQPGVSLMAADGAFTGFDIDIAYMIASDLGFRPSEVRFLPIQGEDRTRMRARDPNTKTFVSVDMVLAAFSITAQRTAEGARFSAPYLRTEQSVVTLTGHAAVRSLSDLKKPVCTLATSTSLDALRAAGVDRPVQQQQDSVCIQGVLDGKYDAATTDAAILAGFVALHPHRLQNWDIGLDTDEAWGVNVGDNEPLRTLVDLALYKSYHDPDDRRWEQAYDTNLRPEQRANRDQDVAVDQQPPVRRPAVRQWPWQR
jgi:glutamate transport system substrate-binding protein